MTTPDIAGLCGRDVEYLREALAFQANIADAGGLITTARVCREAADTIERQAAENKRLRGVLEEAAKTLEHVDGALMDMAEAGAVPAVGTWRFVTKTARKARAALTGEDTAGSPSSQNTEPGLAFSDAGEP
jgi:hypothetical protein